MRPSPSQLFRTFSPLYHENPLGLPRTGTIPRMQRGLPERRPIKDVRKVIAVSSAKGGVGKSTVAANLSLAFARLGHRTGILDTDIFGPSIPTLFNLSGEPRLSHNNQLIPMSNYGVKTMSIGYLVGEDAPVVWRGLMVMKALQQLLHEVDWGGLDLLVLDLPPGTGDTQLSVTQQIVLDGSIIVTTPHTLAVKDAVKGINMFKKVEVPILGLVQNMSMFHCPQCQHETAVFGSNERVKKVCADHDIRVLGEIPLHMNIGDDGERGKPTVVAEPESTRASAFLRIAQKVGAKIGL
ncbi:P-loop containing nucleoside triphosphate hydrolase protein [Pseudomassariella vexata]|uniref:p-loop containing nucleoside triphosphate hydrolase protein n=1 Tax=Pseudomassariella vexata TaxID=1141098 RepID=A0A1Y2DTM1_9PEZI|nr:P-loop containing nucleoside triphosphate hydrolase protein [Pseudomassariella vexata]ORY62597.1 P-loop containing nucleoside triphosphate hydrolase protein [Pseudomassariella vexata]